MPGQGKFMMLLACIWLFCFACLVEMAQRAPWIDEWAD
jgi:hypothetical protein